MTPPFEPDHPDSHEEPIRALLLGECEASDPRVLTLLRDCVECRTRWEELSRTLERLDAARDSERALLEESEALERDSDMQMVRTTLDRLTAQYPHGAVEDAPPGPRAGAWPTRPEDSATPPERPRSSFWPRAVAAAVILVAAVVVLRRLATDPRPTEPSIASAQNEPATGGTPEEPVVLLGDEDRLRLLRPKGEVDRYESFEWAGKPAPGGGFLLRIFDAEEPADPVIELTLDLSPWIPTEEQKQSLPRRIRWEVDQLDAFQIARDSASGSASLRP